MEKFSLKLARAGAELVTRDGRKAYAFEQWKNNIFPYMYRVDNAHHSVTKEGAFFNDGRKSLNDLFLAPFKGQLEGFPVEVVEWMVEQQSKQGNISDVRVFEDNKATGKKDGGFNWNKTEEGDYFCEDVIIKEYFSLFFKRYPKQPKQSATITPQPSPQVTPKLGDMVWVMDGNGFWSDKPRPFLFERDGKYHCVAYDYMDKFKNGMLYSVYPLDEISLTDPRKPSQPELTDKMAVWCWDVATHQRNAKFYDAVNNCTFNADGSRGGHSWLHYEPITPEPEWMTEARKNMQD